MSAAPSLDRVLAMDRDTDDADVIRVTGGSDVQGTASAIASAFYDNYEVLLRAMGSQAVNQAVKAIAVARGFVATRGVDLVCRPGFTSVPGTDHDGNEVALSALVFRLTLD
jgi:stage V sporulation protein S